MKGKLIKKEKNVYHMLASDGSILNADREILYNFLIGFKTIDSITGKEENSNEFKPNFIGFWNTEYPEMSTYPGSTVAYITDNFQLVIEDATPFKTLFERTEVHVTNMLTVKEFAEKHGKSIERIKILCRNSQIKCLKVGRDWLIEPDQPYPVDGRVKTRRYV